MLLGQVGTTNFRNESLEEHFGMLPMALDGKYFLKVPDLSVEILLMSFVNFRGDRFGNVGSNKSMKDAQCLPSSYFVAVFGGSCYEAKRCFLGVVGAHRIKQI